MALSMHEKQHVGREVALRYLYARKKEKGIMLQETTATPSRSLTAVRDGHRLPRAPVVVFTALPTVLHDLPCPVQLVVDELNTIVRVQQLEILLAQRANILQPSMALLEKGQQDPEEIPRSCDSLAPTPASSPGQ